MTSHHVEQGMKFAVSKTGLFWLLSALLLGLTGCTKDIPNTSVPDTPQNRAVINFMEQYRRSVEERDIGALLGMASQLYLDDNGTPAGDDDIDFRTLQTKLKRWRDRVTDVRYEIKYRSISWDVDQIHVDYRYSASFRVALDEEDERWSRRIGENRLVLTRDDVQERFLVLSGM